jgi:glutamate formiminotransferase/formiminotetrahydrofolate cyclodeaminase
MGLDDLGPFDPSQKVIEYKIGTNGSGKLINQTLEQFTQSVASESPAPGGGSVAAYIASCGVSLATMVANLSSHKRGWDDKWEYFSDWAEKGENLRRQLNAAVDADTEAFNKVMEAFGLPKSTDEEKSARSKAIQSAQLGAVDVPLEVMRIGLEALQVARQMVIDGNPNSVTDAAMGVSALACGIYGAYINVLINLKDLKDKDLANQRQETAVQILTRSQEIEEEIRKKVLEMLTR